MPNVPLQAVPAAAPADEAAAGEVPRAYRRACRLAARGRRDQARRIYAYLRHRAITPRLQSLIASDLAVLAALDGQFEEALHGWKTALELDATCMPARLNGDLVRARLGAAEQRKLEPTIADAETLEAVAPAISEPAHLQPAACPSGDRRTKVAILSFLFNWPSTGGGNIHTVELATFLGKAGYDVRHVYASYPDWGIGRVADGLPIASERLKFDASSWNVAEIQDRYRQAVSSFDPDYVLITDAWNVKPLLAEAAEERPYLLRFQALECVCPLNNLRLLAANSETVEQCPKNQLATPDVCRRCLAERGRQSGSLHQRERELCGVGTPDYDRRLRRALERAEAVLVLNPMIEALLKPYARCVRVVPWGMDPARFPWPAGSNGHEKSPSDQVRLFMAAVQGEFIKGFHVAHEACRLLRRSRSDFELVVTFDPPGRIDEFTRSVGWCTQAALPRRYTESDVCLVPTIAQDGLSRTSVEAMACGIPVIASRIGGLPFTVDDEVTGLLSDPGDPADLARQIARLLDDPRLRRQMGLAGRQRFEDRFNWERVIDKHYRPMLARRASR